MVTTFSSTRAFYCFHPDACCLTITCLKLLNVDWLSYSLFLSQVIRFIWQAGLDATICCLSEVCHLLHQFPSTYLQAQSHFLWLHQVVHRSFLESRYKQQLVPVESRWALVTAGLSTSWSQVREHHRSSFGFASHCENRSRHGVWQISVQLRLLLVC